jgi:cysteinyl-tRNA synthetase
MLRIFIITYMIKLFNTLGGKMEPFHPIQEGKVRLYTCGPTVYDFAHIGNYRAYMFEDLLKRFLLFMGYDVIHVMNITDVDDKTIKGAKERGVSLSEYTEKFIQDFYKGLDTLRIKRADEYPKATENIDEMVDMVKGLLDKGYAYEKEGSYYFNIAKFNDYGKLSKIDKRELKAGVRIDSDEYEKESIQDFALWKAKKEEESFYWETEIGPGRPGWHIECSVMSAKYLGETFDIHCGGVDNIFPHHENEIAQSEAFTGKKFVNYWLHCQHLIRDGEKMSKSRGNIITIQKLIENHGADPLALRLLLLSAHYRKMLNFTFDALDQAKSSLDRIDEFLKALSRENFKEGETPEALALAENMVQDFTKGLSDDLNMSASLSALFEMIRKANILLSKGKILKKDAEKFASSIKAIDQILSVATFPENIVFEPRTVDLEGSIHASSEITANISVEKKEEAISKENKEKIELREKAREEKNFELADQIRDELLQKGIKLLDTKDGVKWEIIKK